MVRHHRTNRKHFYHSRACTFSASTDNENIRRKRLNYGLLFGNLYGNPVAETNNSHDPFEIVRHGECQTLQNLDENSCSDTDDILPAKRPRETVRPGEAYGDEKGVDAGEVRDTRRGNNCGTEGRTMSPSSQKDEINRQVGIQVRKKRNRRTDGQTLIQECERVIFI